jgi:hypothetical protein
VVARCGWEAVLAYGAANGVYESTMGSAYVTPGIPPDGAMEAFTLYDGAAGGFVVYLGLSSASLSEEPSVDNSGS